jgi:hypothetical protein
MLKLILQATVITLACLSLTNAHASIGKVSEQSGPSEIIRDKKSIPSKKDTTVEMLDAFVTANAKALITFNDDTTVKITEHSKLIIDDFVYDPSNDVGKLSVKVALGTARYASGQIAKKHPQSVSIKTPTASIAVRGTDFSMTVDEMGRSLVMLLPSCDASGCVTGAIEVTNDSGVVVLLDVAYQATMITSLTAAPTSPVVVNIEQGLINNQLIITPPKELAEEVNNSNNPLDINELDTDALKFTELDENKLDNFRSLDMNALDLTLLENLLDISNNQLEASQEVLSAQASLLPGFSEANGIRYYYNDDQSSITLSRHSMHIAEVTVSVDENKTVNINQDGVDVTQRVNSGGSSTISIIQK